MSNCDFTSNMKLEVPFKNTKEDVDIRESVEELITGVEKLGWNSSDALSIPVEFRSMNNHSNYGISTTIVPSAVRINRCNPVRLRKFENILERVPIFERTKESLCRSSLCVPTEKFCPDVNLPMQILNVPMDLKRSDEFDNLEQRTLNNVSESTLSVELGSMNNRSSYAFAQSAIRIYRCKPVLLRKYEPYCKLTGKEHMNRASCINDRRMAKLHQKTRKFENILERVPIFERTKEINLCRSGLCFPTEKFCPDVNLPMQILKRDDEPDNLEQRTLNNVSASTLSNNYQSIKIEVLRRERTKQLHENSNLENM